MDNYHLLENNEDNQNYNNGSIEIENNKINNELLLDKDNNKNEQSLLYDIKFNSFIRWFTLILLIANIGMFISGHTRVGASVRFNGYIALQQLISGSFLDFSLIDSIVKMWQAKVYILSLLIATMSGLFP